MSGPLESTKYLVLVALAEGPAHGTEIRRRILGDTVGIYLNDGTLYPALKRLREMGLIEEASPGGGWRIYHLSERGARILEHEARTQRRLLELVVRRLRVAVRL